MADAGYSQTNTLLVVVAVAAVAYVLYQRRQPVAASSSGAATGDTGGRLSARDIEDYTRAGADLARGIGELIKVFGGSDERPAVDEDLSYLDSASGDVLADCIAKGDYDVAGNPTRKCVESYS